MNVVNKKQFVSGAVWKIIEQFSAKGVSMIISIILARLLLPEDYGLIALTAVFTNLSDVLIDGGFSTALIRKEKVDDCDYSCVFTTSFLIASFLYIGLFCGAPTIAGFYSEESLISVLRAMGITFFLQAFSSTRTAIINRNMQFKLLFYCNTAASLVSGVIGIIAAYFGMGVWALVIQRLLQQALLTGFLFVKIRWKFVWKFNIQRLKEILSFSLGVVGASLINYVGSNLYSSVIGKKYSVADLGYYDKGGQLPMQFSLYTFGAMSSVLLPTISSCQSDIERVKKIIRKVTCMTGFLIAPIMLMMLMVSKELIVILFTGKWLPAVPIMQYFCIYYLATPFMLINIQVFFAFGKSGLRVKTEIIRLIMMAAGLTVFSFGMKCNMTQLTIVSAIIAVLSALVTFVDIGKLISYSWSELLKDLWKPLVSAIVMCAMIYIAGSLLSTYLSSVIGALIVKILVGMVTYMLISLIIKPDGFNEIIEALKGIHIRRPA